MGIFNNLIRGNSDQLQAAETEAMRQVFVKELEQKESWRKHTPDLPNLSRRQAHKLFIYDALMTGHQHNEKLEGFGEFHGAAFTSEFYELWKKNLGKLSFPVALPGQHETVAKVPIKGELWAINTDRMIDLDNAHENGVQFHRVQTLINIPCREVLFLKTRMEVHNSDGGEPTFVSRVTSNEEKVIQVRAWMYVGIPDYWNTMLDGGYTTSVVRRYNSEKHYKKQYYYFSPKELSD